MARTPRLRVLREEKAVTQEELAELAGVSRGTVARLERGEDAFLPTVRKLAKALGVEPVMLMKDAAALHVEPAALMEQSGVPTQS